MLILPDEILYLITSHLPNRDIKNVRLTNRRLRSTSILRFDRVFLSPSYKNIEVLRAIAGHKEFCCQVKELVYDDARFERYTVWTEGEVLHEWEDDRKPMEEFISRCEQNLDRVGGDVAGLLRARTGANPKPGEELMDVHDNFSLYQQLYEDQQDIIEHGLDTMVLKDAFLAFSSLEKVTVTSEAHQLGIHAPRFPTPLIRSFPPSFNYPAPWPWSGRFDDFNGTSLLQPWARVKTCWRGPTVVLNALANCERSIPGFSIDVKRNLRGIAHQFFVPSSPELKNFEKMCGNLEQLDLAINVGRDDIYNGFRHITSGPLRRALSKATRIRYFSLHTNADISHSGDMERYTDAHTDALQSIPLESWPDLRHLTISHIPVIGETLLTFLSELPPGIGSLTFINLYPFQMQWSELLEQFKSRLNYTGGKPDITIAKSQGENVSRKVWIRDEVARFLDGGHNPFTGGLNGNEIQWGFGTVRDDYDESVEEPWEPDRRMHVQISPGVWEERRPDSLLDDSGI